MSNKTIVCLYTEGETEKVFYDRLLDSIKSKSSNNHFVVDEIYKRNIAGIGNFKNKLLNKFNKEININKYKDYTKIVVLCYDEDVFSLVNQSPPIDRAQLHKDLINCGANKVIHLIAKKSIEDVFLLDIENVLKSLKLNSSCLKNLNGTGYQKLSTLYKKVNKIYVKGAKVEDFVYSLDMNKICKKQCEIYCQLCSILLGSSGCGID